MRSRPVSLRGLCEPAAVSLRRGLERLPTRAHLAPEEVARLPSLLDIGGEPGPKARAALLRGERVAPGVEALDESPARLFKVGVGRRLGLRHTHYSFDHKVGAVSKILM